MRPAYAELHRWAGKPFAWGEFDCCLCLADWVHRLHGRDPAAHLRYTYYDLTSCHRETGWLRDPAAVVEGALNTIRRNAGEFPQTATPQIGDIGVIRVPMKDATIPAGAIRLDGAWGCNAPGASVTTMSDRSVQVLAAWSMA